MRSQRAQSVVVFALLLSLFVYGCATSPKVQWKRATISYNAAMLTFNQLRERQLVNDEQYRLIEAWRVVAAEALDLMEFYAFNTPSQENLEKFQSVKAQFYIAIKRIAQDTKGAES